MEFSLENSEKNETPPLVRAGSLLKAARMAAGMDPNKLGSDLRISIHALEALENNEYDRLPGDPYVRALLGTLARRLGLDPLEVMRHYNAEIGALNTAPPVAPYKDLSETHILAHKQIFILILAVLLFTLVLVLLKFNKSTENSVVEESQPLDSLQKTETFTDTLPEMGSLQPDSIVSVDSTPIQAEAITLPPTGESKSLPTPIKEPHRLVLKPLLDSVWLRVLRSGKPESRQLLLLGNQMEITHSDTIAFILDKKKSVEISWGDTTKIPTKRKFRIIGNILTYF